MTLAGPAKRGIIDRQCRQSFTAVISAETHFLLLSYPRLPVSCAWVQTWYQVPFIGSHVPCQPRPPATSQAPPPPSVRCLELGMCPNPKPQPSHPSSPEHQTLNPNPSIVCAAAVADGGPGKKPGPYTLHPKHKNRTV